MSIGELLEGKNLTPRQMGIISGVWLVLVIVTAFVLAFWP